MVDCGAARTSMRALRAHGPGRAATRCGAAFLGPRCARVILPQRRCTRMPHAWYAASHLRESSVPGTGDTRPWGAGPADLMLEAKRKDLALLALRRLCVWYTKHARGRGPGREGVDEPGVVGTIAASPSAGRSPLSSRRRRAAPRARGHRRAGWRASPP